jgi:polysaccharide pyruvyl transferase WcaK-like protein
LYSIVAQHQNLGDFVIRRVVADWITRSNATVYVKAVGMPDRWIAGFQDLENVVFVRSKREWLTAVAKATVLSRPSIVLAPGPQPLSGELSTMRHQVAVLAWSALVRMRGGEVVKVGRSYPGSSRRAVRLERWQARLSTFYSVRDSASANTIGSDRVVVHPDVAMYWHPWALPTGARRLVAFSLRDGQPEDRETVVELVRTVRSAGLEPIFVSQVSTDASWNRDMSVLLSCEFVNLADERDPRELLAHSQETYSRCAATITNRLHVALLGLACGCVPIAYGTMGRGKVLPCLELFFGPAEVVSTSSAARLLASLPLAGQDGEVAARARLRLDEIAAAIVDRLRNG